MIDDNDDGSLDDLSLKSLSDFNLNLLVETINHLLDIQ